MPYLAFTFLSCPVALPSDQTALPPSSSLRPSVVATDSLGAASTTVSTTTSISVSPLTNGTLAAILLETARQRFNTSQVRRT